MDQIYDEDKAVELINKALTEQGRATYNNDEILNIIDMIWDFYEENGMLDVDDETDDEEDIAAELADYIARMLKKDKESTIELADIATIVNAELDYEDSLIDF